HFPVNIALLNRFTSIKETKKILDSIKNGTIDMVIGTHRLLSNDLVFHDLGLLIIDEEQRFGVIHKEKIKKYKTNIDVLTLTATPIPRTLQMSMVGIRSLSLIETPPVNRYPIQTYVIEENKQIIRDAIYKELSRNGQTFLLYNKVEDMEQQVSYIKDLVPDARVVFAHGQMSKTELEDRMLAFIRHEYDVLICTTIIETGIDIPNVNTLII
ncbi:helicase-related protein, partial [Lactococcus sp.]|uniref:helicase-related protein n=1 Tax=Lactococcus sp. TaxID=44273 RepID=UPI002FC876FB